MSQIPATGSSSSNFRTIFYAAMKGYKKKTGKDLLEHPLMDQLQSCNSPADILSVLRGQVQQSTSGIDKWTKWLIPTVNVLYAFSGAIGEGVGLVSITRTILLRSDILYLGILTCESDFRWRRCPPFSCDRPTFPLLGFF